MELQFKLELRRGLALKDPIHKRFQIIKRGEGRLACGVAL